MMQGISLWLTVMSGLLERANGGLMLLTMTGLTCCRKKKYEPKETAKFQVRMPFRNATALITVEREGIIETFIKKSQGKILS